MKRIFIVGTARSGTTLIHSMLGSHNGIYTFPESHFFRKTIPNKKILRLFHRIGKSEKDYIRDILSRVGKERVYKTYNGGSFNLSEWVKYLIGVIDDMCREEGKSIWVEKTPMHLYYIDLIEKNCQNCQFIHVIREPLANIAALYHAGKKFPESFSQSTVKDAFKRYYQDLKISEKYYGQANHHHIYYEGLVEEPGKVLKQLCSELQIDYDPEMLQYRNAVDQITFRDEEWKRQNKEQIQLKDKVPQRLNENEQQYLKKEISKIRSTILTFYEKN